MYGSKTKHVFGQQNTTTRLWAVKGTRPRAMKQLQFEYACLFGAVCPSTGATEALIFPVMNLEVMEQHLALFSQKTKDGRHAVIIVVSVAWHQPYLADKFNNLTSIKLPPYSPVWNSFVSNAKRVIKRCNRDWIEVGKT